MKIIFAQKIDERVFNRDLWTLTSAELASQPLGVVIEVVLALAYAHIALYFVVAKRNLKV
jgi:hypothetical protein